ncbi:MAG TPA: response regulator transcription factor [Chitinophagaceae bacterium]|nr:response regulator transcription factor [Chitinophagaceae bacterium]
MTTPQIRIVLADDHQLIRESWRMLLENNPRFKVVADCSNGHDAIRCANEHRPDILLVDINMQPLNGFEVVRQVVEKNPSVRIIGMSVNNQPKYATRMVEMGARGYLTKTSSLAEIQHGIEQVYNGEVYICEEVKNLMPPPR